MSNNIIPELGGAGGAIAAVGFAIKYVADAWKARRDGKREDKTATVADAATTNAMLLAALKEERDENVRKSKRIDTLEREVSNLRTEIVEQRESHEEQIRNARAEAEAQIGELRRRLDELQRQISASLPLAPEGN